MEVDDSGTVDFYILREPDVNPRVKDARKITILWRTELNHLLEINRMPKYKSKSKLFVQEKLLEKVSAETLWPQACEELFERDYNTIEQIIEEYKDGYKRSNQRKTLGQKV